MAEQPAEREQQAIPINQPPTVAAVALKLPPFWPTNPAVWFAQVEAQFSFRNVVQQRTHFDYVIAALASEVATEVRDLILNPPADQPYDRLKEALIQRTEASEQRRLQQLLTAEELGDRKPSQLLWHMQQLLGDSGPALDSAIIRQLFLATPPTIYQYGACINFRHLVCHTACWDGRQDIRGREPTHYCSSEHTCHQ